MPSRKLGTNWVTAYHAAMKPTSEAPEQFIIWSAISVISAVLKKKVWVDRGTYKIYPNQYIVLVGPPGIGKGEAIHPAHAFIKDFNTPKLAHYLSDRITAPRIIELLAAGFQSNKVVNGHIVVSNESVAVLQAMELSTLLGASDWMTTFLCDAWDRGEYEYSTKNKGNSHIKEMCVSLIGACVPDFIRKINGKQHDMQAINGGFTARTIFVFGNQKSKQLPWPVSLAKTPDGPAKIAALRHDLERIAELNGEFTFTKDAIDTWGPWYTNHLKSKDEDSDVVRHFKSRQVAHVLKVAMCMSAAQGDSLLIDRWALTSAIALVEGVLRTLDLTFRGVGESSLAEATAKVQSYIERKGICLRQELVRDLHRHATLEDLDRIIYTLITMGCIVEKTKNGGRVYYVHVTNPGTANVP